jgi:hypothetical protein
VAKVALPDGFLARSAVKIRLAAGISLFVLLNCPHFRPDTQHKQEGSSTGLRISLCLTSFDRLI